MAAHLFFNSSNKRAREGEFPSPNKKARGRDPVLNLFRRNKPFGPAKSSSSSSSSAFTNCSADFRMETLNPSSDYSLKHSSNANTSSSNTCEGGELDPELNFQTTFRKIGAGLLNLGNTCFLNSVLQCLTYTEPLAAYMQSEKHKISCNNDKFCTMCAIQNHVRCALQSTGELLAPVELVMNLRRISRNFCYLRQEDAHEYMVNLLESMHKCCLSPGLPSESSSAHEKSLVHKIFGGLLRSQVRCMQCHYCTNKDDPFLDLSLEIFKVETLIHALRKYTAMEQLDGGEREYQCQQCNQKVRATKQLTVHKDPFVLTIQLKRFSSYIPGLKIGHKVDFATTLDLKPFVSDAHEGDLKYTLYGVLVHKGQSTQSGHYYCYVHTSSGMWYSLDDDEVVHVSEKTVLEQKAYMLFYVRNRWNFPPKKAVNVVQKENLQVDLRENKQQSFSLLGLQENIHEGMMSKGSSTSTCSFVVTQMDATDSGLKKDPLPKVTFSAKEDSHTSEPSSLPKVPEIESSMKEGLELEEPVSETCLSEAVNMFPVQLSSNDPLVADNLPQSSLSVVEADTTSHPNIATSGTKITKDGLTSEVLILPKDPLLETPLKTGSISEEPLLGASLNETVTGVSIQHSSDDQPSVDSLKECSVLEEPLLGTSLGQPINGIYVQISTLVADVLPRLDRPSSEDLTLPKDPQLETSLEAGSISEEPLFRTSLIEPVNGVSVQHSTDDHLAADGLKECSVIEEPVLATSLDEPVNGIYVQHSTDVDDLPQPAISICKGGDTDDHILEASLKEGSVLEEPLLGTSLEEPLNVASVQQFTVDHIVADVLPQPVISISEGGGDTDDHLLEASLQEGSVLEEPLLGTSLNEPLNVVSVQQFTVDHIAADVLPQPVISISKGGGDIDDHLLEASLKEGSLLEEPLLGTSLNEPLNVVSVQQFTVDYIVADVLPQPVISVSEGGGDTDDHLLEASFKEGSVIEEPLLGTSLNEPLNVVSVQQFIVDHIVADVLPQPVISINEGGGTSFLLTTTCTQTSPLNKHEGTAEDFTDLIVTELDCNGPQNSTSDHLVVVSSQQSPLSLVEAIGIGSTIPITSKMSPVHEHEGTTDSSTDSVAAALDCNGPQNSTSDHLVVANLQQSDFSLVEGSSTRSLTIATNVQPSFVNEHEANMNNLTDPVAAPLSCNGPQSSTGDHLVVINLQQSAVSLVEGSGTISPPTVAAYSKTSPIDLHEGTTTKSTDPVAATLDCEGLGTSSLEKAAAERTIRESVSISETFVNQVPLEVLDDLQAVKDDPLPLPNQPCIEEAQDTVILNDEGILVRHDQNAEENGLSLNEIKSPDILSQSNVTTDCDDKKAPDHHIYEKLLKPKKKLMKFKVTSMHLFSKLWFAASITSQMKKKQKRSKECVVDFNLSTGDDVEKDFISGGFDPSTSKKNRLDVLYSTNSQRQPGRYFKRKTRDTRDVTSSLAASSGKISLLDEYERNTEDFTREDYEDLDEDVQQDQTAEENGSSLKENIPRDVLSLSNMETDCDRRKVHHHCSQKRLFKSKKILMKLKATGILFLSEVLFTSSISRLWRKKKLKRSKKRSLDFHSPSQDKLEEDSISGRSKPSTSENNKAIFLDSTKPGIQCARFGESPVDGCRDANNTVDSYDELATKIIDEIFRESCHNTAVLAT